MEPTWSGLVEPLERLTDRLGVAWGTVSHLKAVRDSKELREAVEVSSAVRHAMPARDTSSWLCCQSVPMAAMAVYCTADRVSCWPFNP